MLACERGREATARLLVEKRAQLEAVNQRGNTALMYACRNGHEATARLLVEAGAKIDEKSAKQMRERGWKWQ